jgi:hypothetical protein
VSTTSELGATPILDRAVRESHRRRRPRVTTMTVLALCAASIVMVAISLATARPGGPNDPAATVGQGIASLMLVTVGAILVSRLPHHVIGWLLVVGGLVIAISASVTGLADYGLNVRPGTVPAAIWLAWLSQWIWAPEIACLFILLPLFYPTGGLLSPRWRAVVIIGAAVAITGGVGSALGSWVPNPYPVENPLAFSGTAADLVSALGGGVTVLLLVGGTLAVASLVVRYRRAAAIERQQLKWFAAAAIVAAVAGSINIGTYAASGTTSPTGTLGVIQAVSAFLIFCGLALLPLAIGIAVLRYRLYDIDLIIRRTVVYIPLTGILAGLYAASIALLQKLFIAATGKPSDGAVILSTLVLATTFTPIKNTLQARVDRSFRDSQDCEKRLQQFVDAVAGGLAKPDPPRTMRGFLALAVDVSGAMGGRALVQTRNGEREVGEMGSAFDAIALAIPVEVAGRHVGRVELTRRRDGRVYGDYDTNLLLAAGEHLASATLGLDPVPLPPNRT